MASKSLFYRGTGWLGFGFPPSVQAKNAPSPPAVYKVDLTFEKVKAVIPEANTAWPLISDP